MPADPTLTTVTPGEARKAGLQALTVAYKLPAQRWMLDHVTADLARDGIRHAVVRLNPEATKVEVWRTGIDSLIKAARERGEL